MKQIVYIDVLFFINFVLDILIFLSVSIILQRKEKWYKYLISSVIGALYSCFVFYLQFSSLIINFGAIIIYFLVCRFVFNYKSKRLLIKAFFVTVICATLYGGLIFLLYLYTGLGSVMTFSNGALYIDIPVFVLLIFSSVAYALLWLFSFLLRNRLPKEQIVDLLIEFSNNQYLFKGFIDTGNIIKDPFYNLPVIIASLKSIENIIPENLKEFCLNDDPLLLNEYWKKKLIAIPCKSVGGKNIIYAFKCENVYINNNHSNECMISIINEKLSNDDSFNAILPSCLIK